jgi:hypothetical protein
MSDGGQIVLRALRNTVQVNQNKTDNSFAPAQGQVVPLLSRNDTIGWGSTSPPDRLQTGSVGAYVARKST